MAREATPATAVAIDTVGPLRVGESTLLNNSSFIGIMMKVSEMEFPGRTYSIDVQVNGRVRITRTA